MNSNSDNMRFLIHLYKIQMENGMYFIHENTLGKKAEEDGIFDKMEADNRVYRIKGAVEIGNRKRESDFMTNAVGIANKIAMECKRISEGKPKTRRNTMELDEQIAFGLRDQMRLDGRIRDSGCGFVFAVEEGESELMFYDDITGEPLDFEKVIEARKEEMEEFRKHKVYEKVPMEECIRVTGKQPIGVRWVDVNKGDKDNPDCPYLPYLYPPI